MSLSQLKKALELEEAYAKRLCELSLYNFLVYFWDIIIKEEFVPNWHIKYLCDVLQDAAERVIRREPKLADIVINVPPGTSKSTICSVMMPCWCWVKDPSLRFITGSYESNLATDLAVKSRDILKSPYFTRFWGDIVEFKKDEDGKTAYSNIGGGSRRIATVGGNITGFHGHILVVDDAINPLKSASEVEKKKANNWVDGTLSMRKVDKKISLTVYIQQRLAEDDTSGHVLEKNPDDVEHICIPAEQTTLDNVKPKHLNKYYIKGLMDPIRLDRKTLNKTKRQLGEKGYSNQMLQHPAAAEGTIWKRDWWGFYTELPETHILRIIHSWDTDFGKNAASNGGIIAYQYQNGLFIREIFDKSLPFHKLDETIRNKYIDHGGQAVLIEDKASGQSEIQVLQFNSTLPVVPIKPVGDKVVRAYASTTYVEAGNVYLPKGASWTKGFIDMMAGFPDIKKKDVADAFSQLINWIVLQPVGMPLIKSRKVGVENNGKPYVIRKDPEKRIKMFKSRRRTHA